MLALRGAGHAAGLAGRGGAIGFDTQKALLDTAVSWLPERVRLMGFSGTLIGWCQEHDIDCGSRATSLCSTAPARRRLDKDRTCYLENVELTGRRPHRYHPGSAEPWIIAMYRCALPEGLEKPSYLRTLEYAGRWGIEPMFSDFKARGFGIENTQLRYTDRLILVMALYVAVSTGQAVHHPTPREKKSRRSTQESRPKQNLLVHPRASPYRQVDAILPTAATPLEYTVKLIDGKSSTFNPAIVSSLKTPYPGSIEPRRNLDMPAFSPTKSLHRLRDAETLNSFSDRDETDSVASSGGSTMNPPEVG
jgi:hypothetical protein